MQHEIELKLQASPATIRKLGASELVSKAKTGRCRTQKLVGTYFDTPRHTLRKSGISLRVRRAANQIEQTVKIPVPGPLALQTYREWNGIVPDTKPQIKAIDDSEIRAVIEHGGRDKRLIPVFRTDAERRTVPIRRGNSNIELNLDLGIITTPIGHSQEFAELVLELQSGEVADIVDFALDLCDAHHLTLGHQTEAQRGYILVRPALQASSFKAEKPPLSAQITVSEAFQTIMVSALNHLRANESPVAAGHPEGVHQARVAIRRIRAALWSFRHVLPGKKRKAFNREFRWFQGQLSPARDWFVFVDETIPAIQSAFPQSKTTVSRLRRVARKQRATTTSDIADLFESTRYTRLILEFSRWLSKREQLIKPAALNLPLTEFATTVLMRSHTTLFRDVRPLSRMTSEDRHRLRKRAKKTRYACEFFAALWPQLQTDAYLETMKRLQDALGVMNDATVACQLVLPDASKHINANSSAVVREWSVVSTRQLSQAIQPVWRKFQRMQPFWLVE